MLSKEGYCFIQSYFQEFVGAIVQIQKLELADDSKMEMNV